MSTKLNDKTAIVLLSGGQDSAVCLIWACQNFSKVYTVGFNYEQRHNIELEIRKKFLTQITNKFPELSKKIANDKIIKLPEIKKLTNSSLTNDKPINDNPNISNTFVPGRNALFLNYATILAYELNVKNIIIGAGEVDFSNYPDCRDDAIKTMQIAMNLCMDKNFVIHTPLMYKNKTQIWQMAQDLGGNTLVNLIINYTHTCYLGTRDKLHQWGYGCNYCSACLLRANGYNKWINK